MKISIFSSRNVKRPEFREEGFTIIELLVAVVVVATLMALLFPVISRANESGKRATCMNNLRQIYLALQMYADDNDGAFPLLDPSGWVANGCGLSTGYNNYHHFYALYPKYISDLKTFACPADVDGNEIDRGGRVNWSYYYFIFEWPQDPTGAGFVVTNIAGNTRLSQKSASSLPVAMDCQSFASPKDNNHGRRDMGAPAIVNGGNVLFMDGHVKWRNYGTYPSTESVIKKFDEYYDWF